jgi:hypothetical protein
MELIENVSIVQVFLTDRGGVRRSHLAWSTYNWISNKDNLCMIQSDRWIVTSGYPDKSKWK